MSERNYWQRMSARRLSRRSLLRASSRAGVGAAGLALVGCGDDDDDQQQSAAQVAQQQQQQSQPAAQQQAQQQQQQQAADQQAQQADQQEAAPADQDAQQQDQDQAAVAEVGGPTHGGTINRATTINTHDYWDPHRGVFGPTQAMHSVLYNNLIRWQNKEKSMMEADIAELPENPDEETYIFSINPAAAWHDQYPTEGGRNITAQDIAFNVDRLVTGHDSTGAEDGSFLGLSNWQKIVAHEAIDDLTLLTKSDGVDSTFLSATFLRPFGWMAAPEGIQEWGLDSDVWRDEQTTLRVAGSGPFTATLYEPTDRFIATRNPNYWKQDERGLQLPYVDEYILHNLFEETAVETAVRNKELDGAWLNVERVQGLIEDFPQMTRRSQGGGYTIIIRGNFSTDWPGEDGLGNWMSDRRLWAAYHIATDRYLMMDTVYLQSAKPSALPETPWFSSFWAPDQELLQSWPGYRPNRDAELQTVNELVDASGFRDEGREINIFIADVWEERYPGISAITQNMYQDAMGVDFTIANDPYTVLLQRLVDGTFQGQGPCWDNPPSDLDPTSSWLNGRLPGASGNFYQYENPRITEIAEEMKVTLDLEAKKVLSDEAIQIFMGQHPDYGWDGISPAIGVMNPVSNEAAWPYYHWPEDGYQFAHSVHHIDTAWIDQADPEFYG